MQLGERGTAFGSSASPAFRAAIVEQRAYLPLTRGRVGDVLGLPVLAVAFIALVVAAAVWFGGRINEVFCLSVRNGRVLLVRGRIPPGMLGEIRAAVASPPIPRATIRAIRHPHGARLSASGIDEGRTQRLRNIFGLYPTSKLRAAPALQQPTLGQILGIAWLAWLFDRSR